MLVCKVPMYTWWLHTLCVWLVFVYIVWLKPYKLKHTMLNYIALSLLDVEFPSTLDCAEMQIDAQEALNMSQALFAQPSPVNTGITGLFPLPLWWHLKKGGRQWRKLTAMNTHHCSLASAVALRFVDLPKCIQQHNDMGARSEIQN